MRAWVVSDDSPGAIVPVLSGGEVQSWANPSCNEGLMGEQITITAGDCCFAAYPAQPREPLAPAVVVPHDAFGVNADLRQTRDDLAAAPPGAD